MTTEILIPNEKLLSERNGYLEVRVKIKENIWRIFKGIIQMNNLILKNEITEAVKLWINDYQGINYRCDNCKRYINNTYILISVEGEKVYYCSMDCVKQDMK